MKENLVSLPLCQSSTWPVGMGGDPVWHVEAGDEPSEERPRARNTNALLQEIPGFMIDRSWQPRKKGKTNKQKTSFMSDFYRIWEELSGTLGVFFKSDSVGNSKLSSEYLWLICTLLSQLGFLVHHPRHTLSLLCIHECCGVSLPILLPFFHPSALALPCTCPSHLKPGQVQWPLYLPWNPHAAVSLPPQHSLWFPCACDLANEGPLLPCQAIFCLFIVIAHFITGTPLVTSAAPGTPCM